MPVVLAPGFSATLHARSRTPAQHSNCSQCHNNQQARMHPRHILQLLITSALWRCGQGENNTFTLQPSTSPTKKPTRKPSIKNTKIPTLRPTIHTKWGGCTGDASVGTTIQRGAATVVCMTIGPSGDWSSGAKVVRYSFTPTADQFSRFTIPGCTFVDTHFMIFTIVHTTGLDLTIYSYMD